MALNTALDCTAALGAAILVCVGLANAPRPFAQEQEAAPRVVEITARRFAFEPARIDVTEGETVRLVVRSADGVHGLGIKKLEVAEEIPRGGHPVVIEFTATAVGDFDILCTEYCGKGHGQMKGRLVVRARPARR